MEAKLAKVVRTIGVLFLCLTGVVITAHGQSVLSRPHLPGPITEISLGGDLKATIRDTPYDGQFLYLPGRDGPVSLPNRTWIHQAATSPDSKSLLLTLHGSEGRFVCLLCRRSDATASAKWNVQFLLSEPEFDLVLDRRAWAEEVHQLSNDGRVIWKVAQYDNRFTPATVVRRWEEWDLVRRERLSVIKDARPHEQF